MALTNLDVIAGKWKRMTGRVREKWGKLAADEIMRNMGLAEQVAGLVQERYGKSRAVAKAEVDAFLPSCCDRLAAKNGSPSDE